MSGRLLRRVLKERETRLPLLDENEEVAGPSSLESTDRSSRNPFDLLDEDDQVDESESEPVQEAFHEAESKPPMLTDHNNSISKKNRRKKKKNGTILPSSEAEDDFLGGAFEDLSLTKDSCKPLSPPLLSVDPRYLNADNELRRIFGHKVLRETEKTQHRSSGGRGARGRHHCISKRTMLVSPMEHWPPWDRSLSMELLESKDGHHHFRYKHSASYGEAEREFRAAEALHDLNSIAGILRHSPYHVDSLLAMANYFRFTGEQDKASDMIARSVHALERAFHPMFAPPWTGCLLKHEHMTNRPFFLALSLRMKDLDRRGCHRSALEVCKLLLGADPDDPSGALFCIDYHAIRAGEYLWLERFADEYAIGGSLWLFPNISYSMAVCRFYLERGGMSEGRAGSVELMGQALMLHPSVLKKLADGVPLKDRAWSDVLGHRFFSRGRAGIPSVDHLVSIYAERSYVVWRLPDLQSLLKSAAVSIIEGFRNGNEDDAANWACVLKEAFPSHRNEYSHLLVSDFSDAIPNLSPEELQRFEGDLRVRGVADGGAAGLADASIGARDLEDRTVMGAFLGSMLPWVYFQTRGADGS